MKKFCISIVLMMFSLVSFANGFAARDLISRVFGDDVANFFVFELKESGGNDSYSIQVAERKVVVTGNSVVSLTRGAYDYLKNECNFIYTWSGANSPEVESLPVVNRRVASPFEFRYYLNVVTHGYSTAYWTWERWERELDWMALHGYNMPLLPGATEAIMYQTFRDFGLSHQEAKQFFTGPAHFAWNRMGNICSWDNNFPDSYFDKQIHLTHKILDRARELGMTPIIPSFAGFVPDAMKSYFPEISTIKLDQRRWGGFAHEYLPSVLLPTSDANSKLFIEIGNKYIKNWEREFGKNTYYIADTFNEMIVPLSDNQLEAQAQLKSYSKIVYDSISLANPDAVWTMQDWTFSHSRSKGRTQWVASNLASFLSVATDDKILILSITTEFNALDWKLPSVWDYYDGFYGKKWIYSSIPNMGGKSQSTGLLQFYIDDHKRLLSSSKKGNLVGFGTAPEALETNEVVYELVSDLGWCTESIDLQQWIKDYCQQKYGYSGDEMIVAWELFLDSCYGDFVGHPINVYQRRPSAFFPNTNFRNKEKFFRGVELFASCYDKIDNKLYEADLVYFASQYLGYYVDKKIRLRYFRAGQHRVSGFEEIDGIITEMDNLLASHPYMRLSNWVDFARAWGDNIEESDYYESNAKRLITTWGGSHLSEYAAKIWSGLAKDYYSKRWLEDVRHKAKFQNFDQSAWEENWIVTPWKDTSVVYDSPAKEAFDLLQKYNM
ncbi:MAG: alpha-N-acetylglucosaminidase C-terminal domain-containing protein [Spirochaetales bacterium]|nr:alpha-N-acetylglucosaminidase C-terminal domain-containing protein [Spirochaetales bacterium]